MSVAASGVAERRHEFDFDRHVAWQFGHADGGARVRELAPRWATPTLLLWAGADRCVAPAGSAGFAAAAPKALLQARCFDGLFHEIFNEPEKGEVVAELLRWLAALTLAQGDNA